MSLTISQQAQRRDDAGFRAQVSVVIDEEARDMLNKSGQWTDAAIAYAEGQASRNAFARAWISDGGTRASALDVCCRLACATTSIKSIDLVAPDDATIPQASANALRAAVRNAIRMLVALPEA